MFTSVTREVISIAARCNAKSVFPRTTTRSLDWQTGGPFSIVTMFLRSKHSNSQLKRLFKHNPARQRILRKQGMKPRFEELPERQFPKVHKFDYMPNTWTEPPKERPEYPFSIERTKYKPNDAIGFLPVYTKHRNDRTKIVTRIKKVSGDVHVFINELRAVIGLPQPHNPSDDKIKIKAGGLIEVHINCSGKVKRWLSGLGF